VDHPGGFEPGTSGHRTPVKFDRVEIGLTKAAFEAEGAEGEYPSAPLGRTSALELSASVHLPSICVPCTITFP
jgi:hypothetical protein